MRIIIKDAANAQYVLCDGPDRGLDRNAGPVGGMPLDDEIEVQQSRRFRASTVRHFKRGNRAIATTLTIVRESRSVEAAQLWAMQLARDVIRKGTIEMIATSSTGAVSTVRILDAAIKKISVVPLGVTRQVTFTIWGGSLE